MKHLPPFSAQSFWEKTKALHHEWMDLSKQLLVLLNHYHSLDDLDVQHKGDQSPVTKADIHANQLIMDFLAAHYPDIPIISEECIEVPPQHPHPHPYPRVVSSASTKQQNCFFLVDPLDGTKGFIKKSGEFTSNIALIMDGKPVFGFLLAPANDELVMTMAEGHVIHVDFDQKGHRMQSSDLFYRSRNNDKNQESWRLLCSRFFLKTDRYQHDLKRRLPEHTTKAISSAYKHIMLAKNDADFVIHTGPTHEWDIAAGDAILRHIGGVFSDLYGTIMTYNKPYYKNKGYLAFRDIHDLEVCKKLNILKKDTL